MINYDFYIYIYFFILSNGLFPPLLIAAREMLAASWDFVRRHRRKIVAGTALAATAYGTKRLLESGTLRDFVQQFLADNDGPHEQQQIALNEECMNEARRHFLFDVHQQSCDKLLNSLAKQLAQRIEVRFDTTALLEELRTAGDAARKIDIWQQLKVCSIAKLLAVLAAFPLVTLVLKTQKSMVCQQVYRQTIQQQQQQSSTVDNGTSMFQTGIHFMKSFFYEPSTADASTTSTITTNSTTGPKAQKLFNDSVQFLLSDGLDLLFGVMEKIAADIFGPVPLQEPVSSMDLHFLLERARARLKAVGAANNFSEFVVPTAQLNLQINDSDGAKLQALLKHFVLILRTQRCRQLMEDFAGRYMEALLQQLDDSFPSPAAAEDGGGGNSSNKLSLPLAKLIPRICNTFSTLTASGQHSVFFETLTSIELHQFTLFVSECSKEERGSDMLDLVI